MSEQTAVLLGLNLLKILTITVDFSSRFLLNAQRRIENISTGPFDD
jgi:hypothetical protein